MSKTAYVYILASQKLGTLYTGVTSDLAKRLLHREHALRGFTSKYDTTRLVWFAQGEDIVAAIALEKKIKNRGRPWKIELIERDNPDWNDLAADWMNERLRPNAGCAQSPLSTIHETARMSTPTFRLADPIADRAALLEMNIEYVTWVFSEIEAMSGPPARDILGMEVADYIPTVIDKVCGDPPPRGAFHLVEHAGEVIAMGGLRHSDDGVAELKRVYVRPAGRGRRLGEALAERLVADARAFGYRRVRLDTLPFMQRAQAIYEAMGFVDCAPYPVEMPEAFRAHIRYMQLEL